MAKLKVSKKAVEFQGDADRPSLLTIQTYQQINKRELEKYIYGIAEKYSQSLRTCYYQISKFEKGYVVELQSGGNKLGVLKTTLKHLEENESAIIQIEGKKVMITKRVKNGATSITTHTLNETDDKDPTEDIVFVDKLHPIVTNGYGLWRFSIVYAFLGIFCMFAGAGMKYVVNDMSYATNFISSGKLVPMKQVNELMVAKPQPNNYISALKYQNGAWSREEKQFPSPEPKPEIQPVVQAQPSNVGTGLPVQQPSAPASEQKQLTDEMKPLETMLNKEAK
jgi:hypothetical protein